MASHTNKFKLAYVRRLLGHMRALNLTSHVNGLVMEPQGKSWDMEVHTALDSLIASLQQLYNGDRYPQSTSDSQVHMPMS